VNFRAAARPVGFILWLLAVSMLFPLGFAIAEWRADVHQALGFVTAIAIAAAGGGLLWLAGRGADLTLHRKEGLFIVALGWVLVGLIGALPFYASSTIPSFIDAVFESVSGFTTTGASILTDVEALPRSMLLWRSETHWLGGMGIVVLFVAILPALGIGGKHLFRFEATGPEKGGLTPRTADTARTLWLIYTALSLTEFILLWAAGMAPFDAVCHTFGTMATGGFSTKAASIGFYSTPIQMIVTVFMFACGVNFSLYYHAFKGRWLFWKDPEFRTYVTILSVSIVVLLLSVIVHLGLPFWTALRDSAFVGTSIMTTTGYGTADFQEWSYLGQGLLVLLMFIGGCAGSTGGGLKVVRVLITVRWAWKNVVQAFRPHAVVPLRIGGRVVEPEIEHQVVSFTLLFIGWFIAGILALLLCGHDLETSFSASIACLANIGPGLGLVGPTKSYAIIHMAAKPLLTLLMLVGRLEVLAITVLFLPGFWRR
jgi:trk system potassium uptake protein TrkH